MTPLFSIVVPTLNDNEEVNLTVKSIRETAGNDVEIIVIDDGSDSPVRLSDPKAKLVRFVPRRGAGEARHHGATIATSDKLLFIDSHMRFKEGWVQTAIKNMENRPKTLWCGICLGLDKDHMDVNRPVGEYTGATLCFYNEVTKQIYEGVWQGLKKEENYEIPCIMGACYFMYKDWFFYIRGLETNRMWGYEEPFLSLKTWFAGGEVRLMTDVKIGHKFRNSAPYATNVSQIVYNKIRYMYLTLPEEMYKFLLEKIPNDGNKIAAVKQIGEDMPKIKEEKDYYQKIFTRDIKWLSDKFELKTWV